MDTYNLHSIIFKSVDYGETSKIVTAFTKEKGIISIMCKGVKRAKSKKNNLTNVGSEILLELNYSNNFYYLKDGEILSDNLEIRKDLLKIYLSQLFFDIIRSASTPDGNQDIEYSLLSKTLKYLSIEKKDYSYSLKIANMFLIKYISMIGYKPNLYSCTKCSKTKFNQISFSASVGGILCEDDYKFDSKKINYDEYKYLCNILIEVFENIDIIDDEIDERKILKLLIDFILYNLELDFLKSQEMIYKILEIK